MLKLKPALKAAIATLALVVLTAQQDLPQRPPGRFQATTTGLLKGTITGDASASVFRDGRREIYLQLDSSQMLTTDIMLSLQVTLPPGKAAPVFRLQIENLKTQELSYPTATGTLELKGTSMLSGRFALASTAAATPLTITGTFEKAPQVTAVE